MEWRGEMTLAVEAARRAGEVLRGARAHGPVVLSEQGRDIKLQADLDAEDAVLEALKPSGFSVLTEESGEHGVIDAEQPYWVIDPLDGTLNFSRGIPYCAVSIALCIGEEPQLGVVYHFDWDELYTGLATEGAQRNGKEIRVSKMTDPAKAIVVAGFPILGDFDDASLKNFVRMIQRFKKVRMLGSAALNIAYVAAGHVDAYIEQETMGWDVAAGVAFVRAAGGYACLQASEKHKWGRTLLCSSTAALLEELENIA